VRSMLITGGAGFIGCNTAQAFARDGWDVTVVDTLVRRGARENLAWLRSQAPVRVERIDIRDAEALERLCRERPFDAVIHLAAQVAVTRSVIDPREDFEVNALGTFNVLEAVRRFCPEAAFLFASTNKVYGNLEHLTVELEGGRYVCRQLPDGVSEETPLDFHSPYGCSKGAADQYVRDYARIYGLRSVSLRQSCIYGFHQFGEEDQGWVAWFTIAALLDQPITIYGDGRQVRDVLFIDDLVECYRRVIDRIDQAAGNVYNVGGGPRNQLSLLQLLDQLEALSGKSIPRAFDAWRPGDQRVFVSDVRRIAADVGWQPTTSASEGVARLYRWVCENLPMLAGVVGVA